MPESLHDRAARIKEAEAQLKAYRKVFAAQEARKEADIWRVIHALFGKDCNSIRRDYYASVKRFTEKMILELVMDSAEIAISKYPYNDGKRFLYFCGICWNRIKSEDSQ